MKIFKTIAAVGGCLLLTAALTAGAYWLQVTADAKLQPALLEKASQAACVLDGNREEIADISLRSAARSVRLCHIPLCVRRAFLAAEDKKFYSHHGLDYAGMARAAYKNLRARAFVQGASTISQQLVKNTHLTGEKTLRRKLKEIKLTRLLEKRYTKDEILEMYLNTIYFGHACYGIAGAAEYYFGKSAEQLSPAEGATLAAVIRSPNNYSPFVSPEKCRRARDGVLRRMRELGWLKEEEYAKALREVLPAREQGGAAARSYLRAVYEELENLPFFTPYRFRGGCKIYTYLDADMQAYIEGLRTDADRSGKAVLLADNQTRGVIAWHSTAGELRRQPGSLIKPLAVYAPAIEEKRISPCTPVLDEKADFNGYSPSNYKDDYRGYISAREALAESRNVPAVRILDRLGVETGIRYLRRLGLPAEESDRTLALALGGLSNGYTPRELAGAYAALAGGGIYAPLRFIDKIEGPRGELLYRRQDARTRAFSDDTAELVCGMLQSAVRCGTAKKLAALPFAVAAKTGTCGTEAGNTDAWTAACTGSHTAIVWMGNADNARTDIAGGGLPCHYAMLLYKKLYERRAPRPFPVSGKVVCRAIDKAAYEREHRVVLAAPRQPARYVQKELFRACCAPKERGTLFSAPREKASLRCKDGSVIIDLCYTEYYAYIVKRKDIRKKETLYDGKVEKRFTDTLPACGKYIYSVTPYFIADDGERVYGEETVLPSVFLRGQEGEPPKPPPRPDGERPMPLPPDWWKR